MKKLILFSFAFLFLVSFASADRIPLSVGWNQFSIIAENSSMVSNTDDMNVSISIGYNLIGYSSYNNFSHANINYSLSNGTILTMSQAINNKMVREQYSHWTNITATSKGYELIPLNDNLLRTYNAYWIYWNDTTSANVTFNGVGGGLINRTFPFNNLTFFNGTAELNVTDAFTNGWVGVPGQTIDQLVRYWDNSDPTFARFTTVSQSSSLSSWKGYVIWSRQNNVTLCVWENCTLSVESVGGGEISQDLDITINNKDIPILFLNDTPDNLFLSINDENSPTININNHTSTLNIGLSDKNLIEIE